MPAGSAVKPYNGQDYHTTFARRQGRVASSEDFLARLEAVERREAAQGGPPVQASRPKAAQDRAWKPATPPARPGSKPFGKAAAAPQEEKKGFFESLFSGWGNSDPEPAPAPAPVPTRARRASKERVSSPPAPRASPLAPAPAPAPAPGYTDQARRRRRGRGRRRPRARVVYESSSSDDSSSSSDEEDLVVVRRRKAPPKPKKAKRTPKVVYEDELQDSVHVPEHPNVIVV